MFSNSMSTLTLLSMLFTTITGISAQQKSIKLRYVLHQDGETFLEWSSPVVDASAVKAFNFNLHYPPMVSLHAIRLQPNDADAHCDDAAAERFCLRLQDHKEVPTMVEFNYDLLNGTTSSMEKITFATTNKAVANSMTKNQSIDEMFRTIQSEIGQLRKGIEQVSAEEHSEEQYTRITAILTGVGEVILVGLGALFLNKRREQQQQNQHNAGLITCPAPTAASGEETDTTNLIQIQP